MKNQKCRRTVLLLLLTGLWLWFIFGRSLQPAAASSEESGGVLELLQRLVPGLTMYAVRKAAHFTEFFVLGLLLYLDAASLGRRSVLIPAGIGLAAACLDEWIQHFVPGRSGQLSDVLLDACGAAAGCMFCVVLWKLTEKRRRKREHG